MIVMVDLEGELQTTPLLELNITIRKHLKYNLECVNVYLQAVSTLKAIIFGI
jgi:hypothetical protein